MSKGKRNVQYSITFAVSLASMVNGIFLTWTAPAIPKLINNETNINITREQISWVAALGSMGFMLGSLASTFVSDKLGRRTTLLTSAIPVIIGTIPIVCSYNVWLLFLAKLLWGLGMGMVGTVSSIYIAEIADKEIRGSLSVSIRFMFNFGVFLLMIVGPLVTYDMLNYMLLALPPIYFIMCWFIPETPYYYLKEGKVDDARIVLNKLRSFNDETKLEEELELMRKDVKKETVKSGSLKELLTGKQYRKAVIICTGLKIGQMLSGTIVTQHYLGMILQDSQSNIQLSTAFIIFGGVRFVTGIIPSLLADRLGRRVLLIYSFIGTGLSLAVTAVYFFCLEVLAVSLETITPYSFIAFIGIILSVILSTLGYNSLAHVIPAEIFPLNVKSIAMTAANIFGGFLNFFVIKLYQQLVNWFGLFGVFTFFAAISIGGGMFSYFVVPETKGKSLREIQVVMQGTAYQDDASEYLNKTEIVPLNKLN